MTDVSLIIFLLAQRLPWQMRPSHFLSLLTSIKFPRGLNTTLLDLPTTAPTKAPICVAPKHQKPASKKRPHKYISPVFDSQGHPDPRTIGKPCSQRLKLDA